MITADFYNEIQQPQQRGIFGFFDKSFVARNKQQNLPQNVEPLSKIIDYINSVYKN